jgi:site-specific DNA recombinase
MKNHTMTTAEDLCAKRPRVALYIRVSTEEQAQFGYSINGQLEKLELACKLYNWDPLPAYIDEGVSGKNLDRPQIKKLIRDARAKRFDFVLVYKLDRISRRLSDLLTLRDEFEKAGVGIRSATEPFDTTNSAGKLLFNMLGSFAQFEREMIIDRTKMGLRRRMKEGKWNNLPPFGYRLKPDGILQIRPEERPFVKKVFDLFVRDNLGVKMIARQLRAEDHVTRRKGTWARTSVWHMLKNPIYAGLYRIDGKLVPAPHEGIITRQEFDEIQELLSEKAKAPPRTHLSPNVLMGLIKCGLCGSVMTTGKGKGHHYYVCTRRVSGRGCTMAWIPARPVEESVLREIKAVAGMPDLIDSCIDQLKVQNEAEVQDLRSEQVSLEKQLQSFEKTKEQKVKWMLETMPEGDLAEELRQEIQKQLENIKAIKMRQPEITVKLETLAIDDVQVDVIADYLKRFGDSFEGLANGQKRILIQGLVSEVVVKDRNDCRLILTIPLPPRPQSHQEAIRDLPSDERSPSQDVWFPPPETGTVHRYTQSGVANGT